MEYGITEELDSLVTALDINLAGYKTSLLLHSSDNLTTVYAPFDYVNVHAQVVIAGLTPGAYQAEVALRVFRKSREEGCSLEKSLEEAKNTASFSGPMRKSLVKMLDCIGLNNRLGLDTCSTLFSNDSHLVHYTSVLRYPTFKDGKNYSGSPSPVRSVFLLEQLDKYLNQEMELLPNSFWIPLGKGATDALERAVEMGKLSEQYLLAGLPHPSGANAERIAYFLGNKSDKELSSKTNAATIDRRKESLLKKISLSL